MKYPIEVIENAIGVQENLIKSYEYSEENPEVFEVIILELLKELKEYRDIGLHPEVCRNFKIFEDECIRDGITFIQIITLKNILKGMTCGTCRNKGKCAIFDNFNIKYCSDWEK